MSNEPGEFFTMTKDVRDLVTQHPHEDQTAVCIFILIASCKIIELNDLCLISLEFYIGS